MQSKTKRAACCIVLAALIVVWAVRSIYFQRKVLSYSSEDNRTVIDSDEGWIPFGDNYVAINEYENLNGYFIRVNGYRFYPIEEYQRQFTDVSIDYEGIAYGVIEIEVSLKNIDNYSKGVNFGSMYLVGNDFYFTLEGDWFRRVNGFSEETRGGVHVAPGEEKVYKLPYPMNYYRKKAMRDVSTEDLSLTITMLPEERWIKFQ